MNARTVSIGAGLICGLGWISKIVIMALQGGPDPASVPESIAFLAGVVGAIVAAAAVGTLIANGRSVAWRVLAAVAAVIVVGLVIGVGQFALSALPGESWVHEEAIFGVIGLVAAAVAMAMAIGPVLRPAARV